MCTWACLKYRTWCTAIYCCRCCDQSIQFSHARRTRDGRKEEVMPVRLGVRDGREQSSAQTRSASVIASTVIRRLPNLPRTYRVCTMLDPAREPCRPIFVSTGLLRSEDVLELGTRRQFRTRKKEEAQTSGRVDQQSDYLTLLTISARTSTLLRSALSS